MAEKQNELNDQVRDWWNNHPYTYGLASSENKFQDVGDVGTVDGHFFDEYMRKTRKRFFDAQTDDQPLAARFIDYDALDGKKTLDIATGLGWAAVEMARAGADVTAIDLTPRSIEMTSQHMAYRNLDIDLQVMDAQQMTFDDATFDFVHAWGCLMHMPDTEGAIREI
ncbi:MAG: class I SAM-dependent methyltransferase [Chloroflexota bacterium]